MDGATSKRKYPAYTTAQLEAAVAAGKGTPAMVQEIADRKSGVSKPLVVPQILPFCPLCRKPVDLHHMPARTSQGEAHDYCVRKAAI